MSEVSVRRWGKSGLLIATGGDAGRSPTEVRLQQALAVLYADVAAEVNSVRRVLHQVLRMKAFRAGEETLSPPEQLCLDVLNLDEAVSTTGAVEWITNGHHAVRAQETREALMTLGATVIASLVTEVVSVLPQRLVKDLAAGDGEGLWGYQPSQEREARLHAIDQQYDVESARFGANGIAGLAVAYARQHRVGCACPTDRGSQ
jgi:hypothetical protein